eukprot:245523_1
MSPLSLLVATALSYLILCTVTQPTMICVWNSIGDWEDLNGEYTLQSGTFHNYPFDFGNKQLLILPHIIFLWVVFFVMVWTVISIGEYIPCQILMVFL